MMEPWKSPKETWEENVDWGWTWPFLLVWWKKSHRWALRSKINAKWVTSLSRLKNVLWGQVTSSFSLHILCMTSSHFPCCAAEHIPGSCCGVSRGPEGSCSAKGSLKSNWSFLGFLLLLCSFVLSLLSMSVLQIHRNQVAWLWLLVLFFLPLKTKILNLPCLLKRKSPE